MGRAEGIIPKTEVVPPAAAPADRRPAGRPLAEVFPPARYRTPAESRRHLRAFTLFELLIVMLIISIAAAVAVPRYASSVGRYRAESAARRIAADLNLARAKAKAASSTRNVSFNTTTGTYTLAGLRDIDHAAAPYTVNLAGAPYYVTIAYADFGGAPQVQFDMYGGVLWGGTVKVRTGDFERTVTLVKADGTITVQ
jgi:prepilin-type N-terminal cleavage/methylation domain-containing protein